MSLQSWSNHLFEGSLDIASYSDLGGTRVTGLCGTARLGGQVCPRVVWLRVPRLLMENNCIIFINYIFIAEMLLTGLLHSFYG